MIAQLSMFCSFYQKIIYLIHLPGTLARLGLEKNVVGGLAGKQISELVGYLIKFQNESKQDNKQAQYIWTTRQNGPN